MVEQQQQDEQKPAETATAPAAAQEAPQPVGENAPAAEASASQAQNQDVQEGAAEASQQEPQPQVPAGAPATPAPGEPAENGTQPPTQAAPATQEEAKGEGQQQPDKPAEAAVAPSGQPTGADPAVEESSKVQEEKKAGEAASQQPTSQDAQQQPRADDANYQTNRPEKAVEDGKQGGEAQPSQEAPPLQHADTNQRIEQVEQTVLDGLEKERKLATEMGQIPEAVEPEETARDNAMHVKPSTSQGVDRDKTDRQAFNQGADGETIAPSADMKFQTSPRADFQNAANAHNAFADAADLNPPMIEIDRESLEFDYSNVTSLSINRELYLRLVKTAVLEIESADAIAIQDGAEENQMTYEKIQASSEMLWPLSQKQTGQFLNGIIFGRYLIFLKKHMKHQWNQIWSIKVAAIKELKQGTDEHIVKGNWQLLCNELDKISINIQEDSLEAIYRGEQKPIDAIFNRIERYSKMITDAQFLKYEAVREEDKYNDGMDDTTVYNAAITDENLSEMISLRQQQTFRSNISKPSLLSKMITRGETKIGSKFILPPGINLPPQKSETMKTNNLRVRGQKSDDIMNQSVNSKEGGGTYIKVAEDFGSEASIKNGGTLTNKSPKPRTETLGTDMDVTASNDAKQMENILIQGQNEPPSQSVQPRGEPKKVKDGVDILALNADKDVSSCDSSLELILVTLSKSFLMSPKQAAALLTNNNQYLIIACIRGVKGGKFEPLLAWYDLLISNCETLAELLQLEMEQLPASAKQTFVKVMAAVGCGFFSSNIELVQMTFAFFTELFQRFQSGKSMQALEQATKWFLSDAPPQTPVSPDETTAASLLVEDKQQNVQNQQELINAGGLKLSVYALRKHQEVTRQAMVLYNVFFRSEEQAFMIYATEIQASTKTVLEYMELVGEFLPIMSEMWPETAINSGLVDYWLDLCSREAENDFKVQNREKVLAISLLAEIWLLFTDYVDDKDEVTNTLIFVFKRTVSERTKSIRLLSIAYLFKILEKLIELKKKAALTLYRTLIFSLVEAPSDPTVRELYFTNFADLFRANPKMPSEWLSEPLLKQIQAQLNITFSLKIFDFTFMTALIEHPKFKDEHATALFTLFAQVSLDDTSYATAAHQIMLMTLERFLGEQQAPGQTTLLQEKAQEHVRLLFDLLLDLEPITRAAAMTLMKRQQRQNALKYRQGAAAVAAGRSSQASIGLVTPGSNSNGKPPLKARDLLGAKSVNQTASLVSLTTGAGGGAGVTSSAAKPSSQKDLLRRHKKSLAITFLIKLQALGLPQLNNNFLRELVLEKTREFKGVYGYFNKGHIELLKAYGDPDSLILDCQLDPQLIEQQQLEQYVANENNYGSSLVPARKTSVRASPYTKTAGKNAQYGLMARGGGVTTPSRNTSQRGSDARLASQDSKDVVAVYEEDAENNQQVVPYTEQSSANIRMRSIGGRARALQEIEKIKKQKQDREQKKLDEQQKLRVASAKRKKRLKIEIQKRKHELGIADKAQNKYALLGKEGQDASEQGRFGQPFKTKQVVFIKLDEEEDRDRDTVLEYMRKYQKLWRNIFAKYQNTGHKAQALQRLTFDPKSQTLTYAEITKLLKDHGTYPQLINKEELSQMIRLINQKHETAKSADIQSLTYQGYQSFIVQLSVHCFSRPPQNLSSQPMVKSIEALVRTFEEATRKRNLSTLLYEDPDAVVALTPKDKEMIRSLNQTVKEQPDYPMPEGFLKVKERVPVYDYSVPEATIPYIGEAKAVCVELVDELVSKLFDFHVLEPVVTMQEQYRVKPSMQRSLQKDSKTGERGNRAEALSIIRRAEEKQRGSVDGIRDSRGTNRSKLPKIGQQPHRGNNVTLDDLPPLYKQLVAKQPAAKKPIYEQVSVILENMIRKTCGEKELRPQMIKIDSSAASDQLNNNPRDTASSNDASEQRNSIPVSRGGAGDNKNLVRLLPPLDENEDVEGIKYNQAKALKDKQNALERKQKEKKRQERQKKLKEDLAKLKEERKAKEEEDKVARDEEAKKKKEQDKKLEERRKKLREEQKNEAVNKQAEEDNQYDAEAAAAQAEEDRQKEIRKQKEKRDFFRKQQEKLNNQFKNMSEQRKADSEQQKQKALKEKQQKQQLRERIDQQNKLGQGHRERQLAQDVVSFLQRPEVRQLFSDHEKSLLKYFKYYCRQNRVELGHDLQFRLEHLDFTSFNKLGLQSKIIPVLISSEQLKSTFRNTVKQAQPTNADLAGVQNSQDNIQPSGRANSSLDTVANNASSSQHIDYESFKKALVRIAILGQELLGGQSEEQRQRKAQLDEKRRQAEQRKKELMKNRQEQRARLESETLAEMRQEYVQKQRQIQTVTSRSPAKSLAKVQSEPALNEGEPSAQVTVNEEDFQRWLKQQDAIGNGLGQRVTEKMNKASKPRPAGGQAAANGAAEQDTPTKVDSNSVAEEANNGAAAAGQAEDGGGAPLLRAKQSQARGGGAQLESAAGADGAELDIAFISADTIKSLFDFMHVEAGDEGERNIDQVLAAQSSLEGRGRPAGNQARRGVSKEPSLAAGAAGATATPATPTTNEAAAAVQEQQ